MLSKKTKIICTLGPSSFAPEKIMALAEAGMDLARLNLSHGTHQEKAEQIKHIRDIGKRLDKPIGIIADLQGPKLRLGEFEGRREIKEGEIIHLSLNPVSTEIPIQFDFSSFIKKGHRIFLNDALVELRVIKVSGKVIHAKALNSGFVSAHKGINIPDTNLKEASFTQKDYQDSLFAIEEGVDYIALSFVQTADDLKPIKKLLKEKGSRIKLIAKIERKEAVENLEQIISTVDGVMVARGDLAIETNAPKVPIIQQRIIRLSRQLQKPVIVATQMLESMIENPRPTRAETSDVANAVIDQVDAVMLSGETASGKYPVEAVKVMTNTILAVEESPEWTNYIKIRWEDLAKEDLAFEALVSSAASIGFRIGSKLIVVATATGKTAKLLSSFRPQAAILAVTHDDQTRRALSLVWGIDSLIIHPTSTFDSFLHKIIEEVKKLKILKKGDQIVVVTGSAVGSPGATDTLKIITL